MASKILFVCLFIALVCEIICECPNSSFTGKHLCSEKPTEQNAQNCAKKADKRRKHNWEQIKPGGLTHMFLSGDIGGSVNFKKEGSYCIMESPCPMLYSCIKNPTNNGAMYSCKKLGTICRNHQINGHYEFI